MISKLTGTIIFLCLVAITGICHTKGIHMDTWQYYAMVPFEAAMLCLSYRQGLERGSEITKEVWGIKDLS